MKTTLATATRPPGPSGRKLFGSLLEIRRDRIRFVTEATREYGDVVSFRMGPRRIYLLRRPDHLRHVLVDNQQNYQKGMGLRHAIELLGSGLLTSEGAQWARQRKDVGPVLSSDANIQRFAARASEIAARRISRWTSGAEIDMAREAVLLGVAITGSAMLGCNLEDVAEQIAEDLNAISADAMRRMTAALPGPWLRMSKEARAAIGRMDELVHNRLRQALANGETCFPGLLASARGNARELRDQVLTLLLAGHETTASTLSWAFHLLAQHPQVQTRVHDEISAVLGGRVPAMSDVAKLSYTSMVLHETMRLYPAVWLLPRRSVKADVVGGYEIPGASDVLLSVYSMHRHPEFWTAPDEFVPERFSAGASYRAYMPFGAGPRMCVGRRLGILETTITLAAALRRFHFIPVRNRTVGTCASLTLHPSPGLWLRPLARGHQSGPVAHVQGFQHESNPGEEQKTQLG